MMNVQNIIDRIREILDDETLIQLKEELNSYHVADLADIFQELKPEERLQCFKLLDLDKAADLMEYLPPQIANSILEYINKEDNEYTVIGGFINFKAGKKILSDLVEEIFTRKKDFGMR